MEKKQNVPALRFPEFSGEWKRKKLLDVLDINSGQDYKALGAGTIPVYGTGGYMLSVDRALSYEKDAIGIGRKGTIDNPFILKAPFWTVDTLFYAIPKEEYDLDFILGIFKNVDWRSKDESTGVPSLSKVAIGKTIAYIPFFMEQQKIGGFIARLNRQEQLFQNKIQKLQQFQQAMLAKLFPREGAAEPELRFRGFSGKWRICTLAKCAALHARIGWQNLRKSEFLAKGDYYLITGTDFVDGQIEWRTCHYVSKLRYDQDKNIQVQNGDILVTKDGTLGKVAYVDGADKPATLNAGVFNVKINVNDVDAKYLYQYLKGPYLMDYVNQRATGGTIKHLNQNILVDFPVVMPSFEEQKIIGDFFYRLDRYISLQQKKLERMQRLKAALLEKLFV